MKFPLTKARRVAEEVLSQLMPGCLRIEIAGSIRRGVIEVKDIELVCEPAHRPDLFGGEGFDLLNETLRLRVRERKLLWRGPKGGTTHTEPDNLDGRRYYSLATDSGLQLGESMPIDLFVVRPPAQWGAIFAIRTGPADYARQLVTHARANRYKCEDGRLVSLIDGTERLTATEQEFIEACGLRFMPPHLRR